MFSGHLSKIPTLVLCSFPFTEMGQEMIQRVSNIIESSELGRVLQKCLNEVKVMECVTAYLSDFVQMVYHVTSKEEHKVI